ncbi:MAG TPA: aldo/keto reductase [Terriglobales bacterium]|nr:aldo/keto reductase [Terriglobales bacterium]
MNYRTLGSTGLKVSEIGFGSWAIGGRSEAAGEQWGWGDTPEADAIAAVQRARDLGVNFFDTADVYGNGRSEEILGKALGPDWSNVLVASKAGNVVRHGKGAKDWTREHLTKSCEATLKRLKKDVIDVYQLHNPSAYDIRHFDWVDTMELLQKHGKIRFYGVSIFLPEEGIAVLGRGKGHVIQLGYNALRLEMQEEVIPLAQKKNFGIIARVPLYYGLLSGKFKPDTTFAKDDHRSHTIGPMMSELVPRAERVRELAGVVSGDAAAFARWSLKFILANPAISTVIPGARNPQQAESNCSASDGGPLPAAQVEAVHKMWSGDPYLKALRTEL